MAPPRADAKAMRPTLPPPGVRTTGDVAVDAYPSLTLPNEDASTSAGVPPLKLSSSPHSNFIQANMRSIGEPPPLGDALGEAVTTTWHKGKEPLPSAAVSDNVCWTVDHLLLADTTPVNR